MFRCHKCDKNFVKNMSLRAHLVSCGKYSTCNICGKSTYQIKKHLEKHKNDTLCTNCGKTKNTNNRFCSLTCSASYNNTIDPKRKRQTFICLTCGESFWKNSKTKYCSKACNPRLRDWNSMTLEEFSKNRSNFQKHARLRGLAREIFNKSNFQKQCRVCSYDLHVDICHIKPVSSFSDNDFISEINHIDNLIPLCKNHHWEFDNGYLKIETS